MSHQVLSRESREKQQRQSLFWGGCGSLECLHPSIEKKKEKKEVFGKPSHFCIVLFYDFSFLMEQQSSFFPSKIHTKQNQTNTFPRVKKKRKKERKKERKKKSKKKQKKLSKQ